MSQVDANGSLSTKTSGTARWKKVDIELTGDLNLESGGKIDVSGKGYPGGYLSDPDGLSHLNGYGPGGGTGVRITTGSDHEISGGGGGHAGKGGKSIEGYGGGAANSVYDLTKHQIDFGSGGGAAFTNGAASTEGDDWIVSMGGGSPIDAAKAMWAFYEYPDTTFEDLCIPFNFPTLRQKARFLAIPSTSGTATEVTAFSVITDYAKGIKYPLADFNITPDIAVVDPDLAEKRIGNQQQFGLFKVSFIF
jgi:hypothetical protein